MMRHLLIFCFTLSVLWSGTVAAGATPQGPSASKWDCGRDVCAQVQFGQLGAYVEVTEPSKPERVVTVFSIPELNERDVIQGKGNDVAICDLSASYPTAEGSDGSARSVSTACGVRLQNGTIMVTTMTYVIVLADRDWVLVDASATTKVIPKDQLP